jgi:O-antigen ligase
MVRAADWLIEHYRIIGFFLLVVWGVYWAYTRPYSIGDPLTYLTLIGAQLLLVAIFHYRRVFFLVVMISFLWAGLVLPLKAVWGTARWGVLLCAAVVGLILWLKEDRQHFGAMHLFALFCSVAAITSAVVSAFPRTAFLKAISLLLLFLYTTAGARLAVLNREWQFSRTLVTVCEVTAYFTAVCYYVLHLEIFGNPNSLGAVIGVVLVPVLTWGVLAADSNLLRRRSALALAISATLLVESRSRAGLLAGLVGVAFLLLSLKRYRLFLRSATVGVAALAIVGLWSPDLIWKSADDLNSDLIYKGHRNLGLLGSRMDPWNATMATIREHPFFGGGFGTTQTGAEDEKSASAFSTTMGTSREHGNSYLALLEWVGLLGIVPFLLLLGGVLLEIRAVSRYMRRTLDSSHPAIPLATICLAGLVGATFEDWLFAVGYYLSVFVWCMVFCLVDLTRQPIQIPSRSDSAAPPWQQVSTPFLPQAASHH